MSEIVSTFLHSVVQDRWNPPRCAVRQLLHAWTTEELLFKSITEGRLPEEIGRYFHAEPGAGSTLFFLALQFFVGLLIMELCPLASRQLASYGTMMAFTPKEMRNVEAKCLSGVVPKWASVLLEANVLCDADVKKAVTQYSAFNKKLLKSWWPSG